MAIVKEVRPYAGPVGDDGTVVVYDLTVPGPHAYPVCGGLLVGNSKRVSLLDVNALLAHGAYETIRDAVLYRGQRNDDYWLAFMQGHTPPSPQVPFAFQKFVSQLKAAGVNVVPDGPRMNVMAMTNKDVEALAEGRRVTAGTALRDKDGKLTPEPGGLFDPKIFGPDGRRWGGMGLDEPMVNPLVEEPARRLLGLTQKKFEGVIAGTEELPGRGTGPKAIADALGEIDVPKQLEAARNRFKASKGQARDDAARRLGYLKALDRMKMHPRDWVLDAVPVLPAAFRPVGKLPDGTPVVPPANHMYLELFEANKNLQDMKKDVGDAGAGAERLAVYNAIKAVVGLGESHQKQLRDKGVKGILHEVLGSSPKFGKMQRSLISTTVDNVGRAIAIPNADLDMDSVGIPENAAFSVYKKFVARRLARRGMPLREALREIEDKSDRARAALLEEMEARPVQVNRAPVLHKLGYMAFRPRLTPHNVIEISPLVFKGFGLDSDGDQMNFHVPGTDEAVKEAYDRMLPSRNLFYPADMKTPIHVFGQDYLSGLYSATADVPPDAKPTRTFATRKAALAAMRNNELAMDEPVRILED